MNNVLQAHTAVPFPEKQEVKTTKAAPWGAFTTAWQSAEVFPHFTLNSHESPGR